MALSLGGLVGSGGVCGCCGESGTVCGIACSVCGGIVFQSDGTVHGNPINPGGTFFNFKLYGTVTDGNGTWRWGTYYGSGTLQSQGTSNVSPFGYANRWTSNPGDCVPDVP